MTHACWQYAELITTVCHTILYLYFVHDIHSQYCHSFIANVYYLALSFCVLDNPPDIEMNETVELCQSLRNGANNVLTAVEMLQRLKITNAHGNL